MRKDFVANASHELRSPLTVITGYLDSLADDAELDPIWQAPVEEMRRQSERMRGIVQDLLELSRLEAQGGEADRVPVDVARSWSERLAREFPAAALRDVPADNLLAAQQRLVADGQLMAYKNESFWQCMDTLREKHMLEQMWQSGHSPWKTWKD